MKNIWGVDLRPEFPKPNIVIVNDFKKPVRSLFKSYI